MILIQLPLKTEKERLIHRIKTGHYMGENVCFVCLQVVLKESSWGYVHPIVPLDKLSTDTGISIDVIKGTEPGLKTK